MSDAKKEQVKLMFDSISQKYDFLNHFLSAGVDFYWRKKALRLTGISRDAKLLDVACGTGDFAYEAKKKFGISNITGVDLSLNMLKIFKEKFPFINGKIVQAVAEEMPFKNESFTNITVAFGVRNFYDINKGFEEFYRILSPSGKVTVLELRLPRNPLIKKLFDFYFSKILPLLGKIISKDPKAYNYLPESVHSFDKKINLKEYLSKAGFTNIAQHTLTFGIVQVAIAEKGK